MGKLMAYAPPQRLYKYLYPKHVSSFLAGNLYLQNLAAFRQVEDKARGDRKEGMNVDRPAKPFEIQQLLTVRQAIARRTQIDSERVFVLCLSLSLKPQLVPEFGGAVVEIADVPAFIKRLRLKVSRHPTLAKMGLRYGAVRYYTHRSDADKPMELPFSKHDRFAYQEEYRMVCGYRRGFQLEESVVNALHSESEEIAQLKGGLKIIRLGDLRGIAREVFTSR